MNKILTILLLSSLFVLNANELKFGIYTSDKPSVMYKKFKPIINFLEDDLQKKGFDFKVTLKIYPTYEKAIDGLVNNEYDFARFGPASYILAKQKNEKIRLLVMEIVKGQKTFNGVFITKRDSNINSLSDLKNKTFAFGNNKSTIGRYLSQEQLLKNGISSKDLKSFEYLGRHDKVALSVANNSFDAGVVKEKTFNKYKNRGLKVFHKFKNVTKPWLVKENMDEELYKAIKESMINLKDKEILGIFKGDGFVETNDFDYDFVRKGMKLSERF